MQLSNQLDIVTLAPDYVGEVAHKLLQQGHQVFVVGGAPRDLLLGLVPSDWDLATSALPDQVKALFPPDRLVLAGEKFGTVGVVKDGKVVQVTTFRGEQDYHDGRHPTLVTFLPDIEGDLARRDFTVNAIAVHWPSGAVLDPFDGINHLRQGVICTVGDPNQRFAEDALRMLRAARFSAEYGWDVQRDTRRAVQANAQKLALVSVERIRDELNKLLLGKYASKGLQFMLDNGLMKVVIPELEQLASMDSGVRLHNKPVVDHSLEAVELVPPTLPLRYAALLHDIGKPACVCVDSGQLRFYGHERAGEQIARQILSRLKLDNATVERTCMLVREHMRPVSDLGDAALRRLLRKLGPDGTLDLLELKRADMLASGNERGLDSIVQLQQRIRQVIEEKQPLSVCDLAISGHDVMAELQIKPGPTVGRALGYLLEQVLEDPAKNERGKLLELLRDWWRDQSVREKR
ncbi:MAG: CCA tRNA nucleotidyltransferase [Bacillota bacterium]